MEPIGICGGGLVALLIFLVAIFGSAILAGGIAVALAKLGVTVDARLKSAARGRSGPEAPEDDLATDSHPPPA